MRTSNSLKNIFVSIVLGVLAIIINFIVQRYFINSLGVELLGLNSLFTNIISMLSVAELGFGSAVIFHLYKPLHKKDTRRVSSLMRFYRTSYRWVALMILVLAAAIAPFLTIITGDHSGISENLYLIYGLFVINSVLSYLMSYKRSVLYADQKNYIINLTHLLALTSSNIIKIVFLITTRNYYLFLTVGIVATIIENFILNYTVNKRYNLEPDPQQLDSKTKQDIFRQIKGLLFHKVGTFIITGTDNIIISMTLGLHTLGLFSNYQVIILAIQSLYSQVSNSIRAGIGNLLVDVGAEQSFTAFSRLQFANHILTTMTVSVFAIATDSLISVWLGDNFVLDPLTTITLSLTLYLTLTRSVFGNFKEAAGIFYEDRFVPIVESVINIIASLILVQFLGLAGVFIGTALSSLALHCYSYPKFVYKGLFQRGYGNYMLHVAKNFFIAIISIGLAFVVSRAIVIDSGWLQLAYHVTTAIITPLVFLLLIHHKSEEYIYFKKLSKKILQKIQRSSKK